MRPFRFGIARSRVDSAKEWTEFARSAGDDGFDAIVAELAGR